MAIIDRHKSNLGFNNGYFLSGLICFTLAVFLVAIAIPMLLRSLAFQSTGVTAKGIILSHDSSTDSDDKVSYYLEYSYKDKAEHKYTGRDEVSESLSESTADGTSCLITYLKDNPAVSKLSTTDSKYVESLVFLVMGGASILIGVFPLGFGARMGFQRLHLLAKGQLQPAIVTSVDVTESKDDDGNLVKSYNLHYEYVAGANIVPGVTKLNNAKATEWTQNLAKGVDRVEIAHDPTNPTQHVVIINNKDRRKIMNRAIR